MLSGAVSDFSAHGFLALNARERRHARIASAALSRAREGALIAERANQPEDFPAGFFRISSFLAGLGVAQRRTSGESPTN